MNFAPVLHLGRIGFRQLSLERNPQPVNDGIVPGDKLAHSVLDRNRPVLSRPVQALGAIQQYRAIEPESRPKIHGHAVPHFLVRVLLRYPVLEVNPQLFQVDALRRVELALTVHQAQPQIILAHGIQQHGTVKIAAAIKQSRPPERNGGSNIDIPQQHLLQSRAVKHGVHAVNHRIGRMGLLGRIQQPFYGLGVQGSIAHENHNKSIGMAHLVAILAAIVDVTYVGPESSDISEHGFYAVRGHRGALVALLVDELPALLIGEIIAHRKPPLDFVVHQAPCCCFWEKLQGQLLSNQLFGLIKFEAHDLIQPLANIGLIVEAGGDRGQHSLGTLAGRKIFEVNFLRPHPAAPPS